MRCPLCNAEIKEGSLYCEKCGEDIHIVPDYDPIIEGTNQTIENISQNIFTEENKKQEEAVKIRPAASSEKPKQDQELTPVSEPRRKRSLFNLPRPYNYIFIAFAFVVIFAITILAFVFFTSDKYKLKKADQAYESGEYTKAAFLYEELIAKDPYDLGLQQKYSLALRDKGDTEGYKDVLISIFDNSFASLEQKYDSLAKLVDIYDEAGEFENIQKLVLATKDDVIIKRYSRYFVDPPTIVTPEGQYELPQLLIIETEDKDCDIYYTINCTKENNTSVIAEDTLYAGSILLDEGVFNITAYAVNEKGVKSEPVTAKIEIKMLPPVAPLVVPASGEYYDSEMIEIDNYSEGKLSFYYTTNGTIPTSASNKYTEPLVMLPGVSWYKFICIDERGLSSDVVDVRYVFDIETNFTVEQAHDLVFNYLFEKGITDSPDGSLKDGGMVVMRLVSIISEEENEDDQPIKDDEESTEIARKRYKYVFEEYMFNEGGKLTGLDTRYSVDVNTGEVEKVE